MTRCFPCLFSHQIEFPDIWKDNIILVRKLIAWFTHPKPYSKHISEYIASTGPYCIKLMFIIKIWSSDVFFSFLPPNQWLVTMSFQLYLFKQHWPCESEEAIDFCWLMTLRIAAERFIDFACYRSTWTLNVLHINDNGIVWLEIHQPRASANSQRSDS